MDDHRVIPSKRLPVRPPIVLTVTMWLLLDRLYVSEVVWGIMGTVIAIVWIAAIYAMIVQKFADPFDDKG